MAQEMLTTKQAAAYINLRPATLEAWRCRGGGPVFIKLGKACRYRMSSLEEFLRNHSHTSTSEIDSIKEGQR